MLKPFTKWTGGKRQLLPVLREFMPKNYDRYFEPFIGGGALFFDVMPGKSTIGDLNGHLIDAYISIRDDLESLIELLKKHEKLNSKEYYLSIREMDRNQKLKSMTRVERAARIIYMLRVDFNGLYRVNSKGQFNVPYGKYKNPKILDKDLLKDINEFLNINEVKILNKDYEDIVKDAKKGDFVYFDPPYVPLNATSAFTAYTQDGFSQDDQIRLRDVFKNLSEKGVKVMLSNSDTEVVRELYGCLEGVNIKVVKANRMINSKATKRGKISELIIRNYEN